MMNYEPPFARHDAPLDVLPFDIDAQPGYGCLMTNASLIFSTVYYPLFP
ncbi:hypothetical protein PhaeoP23_00589 [Phaeobacter piscinae]|uniref:Uncharacterized protein n=1 Tax=Phaeobacter piscinae TaxID=1580596 RepID=A0ABM6PB13_9RHOB|nr:hypothetical protein PhaeoP36_00589 [Phaeobacter piscinae]AUQ85279.1 hypothetical protein PhaeoP42_00589 [Phaeobacter piscinae]AUR23163.1 hypothetical protein PhaeoP23_00589 [Phaeobacter piscinae]